MALQVRGRIDSRSPKDLPPSLFRDGKVLAHLKAGDFCGEMSLIDGKPRSATVVAESPCVVLVIDNRSFRALLDTTPGLQRKILVTLCQRLRDADTALAAVN